MKKLLARLWGWLTRRAPDQPKAVAQDWVDGQLVTFYDEGGPYKPAGG